MKIFSSKLDPHPFGPRVTWWCLVCGFLDFPGGLEIARCLVSRWTRLKARQGLSWPFFVLESTIPEKKNTTAKHVFCLDINVPLVEIHVDGRPLKCLFFCVFYPP